MSAENRNIEFVIAGQENSLSLAQEFFVFATENRKWALTPVLLALSLVGLVAVFGSTGAAPFIYTLF